MDIHERFSYQVPKLKKLVENIKKAEEKSKEEEANGNLILDENYESEWDRFTEFLRDLVNESFSGDDFKRALFWAILDEGELDLHEQVELVFDYLTEDSDKILKSIVYTQGSSKITVDLNEIKDLDEE